MSSAPVGSATQAAPWDRLRAWIDSKQAWERQNGSPAPLTQRELKAIADLVTFIPEPEVGDEDHVSVLMRHVQGNQLEHPVFTPEGVDITINGLKELRWRNFCTLSSIPGRFPRVGYGFAAEEEPPAFKSKKNAKQFAAQQAMAFIQGRASTPPPPAIAPSIVAQINTPSPQTPASKRARLLADANALLNSPGQQRGSASPSKNVSSRESSADSPTIFECVDRAAKRLGMEQPKYQVVLEDGSEYSASLYRGYAEFRLGTKIPEEVGIVRGVLGKTETRVEVAQQVLAWMQKELNDRQNIVRSMLGENQLPSGGP